MLNHMNITCMTFKHEDNTLINDYGYDHGYTPLMPRKYICHLHICKYP